MYGTDFGVEPAVTTASALTAEQLREPSFLDFFTSLWATFSHYLAREWTLFDVVLIAAALGVFVYGRLYPNVAPRKEWD